MISKLIAYILIVAILALLAWTTYDLYRGNKRYAAKLAAHADRQSISNEGE